MGSGSHEIVADMLARYADEQLSRPYGNKTAESIAHLLAGMRVTERYRVEPSQGQRNSLAHEFLRGVLTDKAV